MKKDIKRILLIFPHYVVLKGYIENISPPLGIGYIAAVLEKEGYNVEILDVAVEDFENRIPVDESFEMVGLDYGEIKRRIGEFNPDVVGVSCLFSTQYNDMKNICRIAKEVNSEIVVVVGGEHPSALPEQTLENESIDFVVVGEGENVMKELMNSIRDEKPFDLIDALGYKKESKITVNPKTKFVENLDDIPFPARHLMNMEKYFRINLPQGGTSMKSPNTSIMFSRGCTGSCVFCATSKFWGRRFRARSPENVISEMEMLKNTYGIKELQFLDDNLTLNKDKASKLFDLMIEKNLDFSWCTPQGIAAWTLDEDLLKKMKASGCYEITIAIESGCQRVLSDIIHKPLRLEKIKPIVEASKNLGIITKAFFVVGFPGETMNEIKQTFKFANSVGLDAYGVSIATPLPGTELYRISEENGYIVKDFRFDRINYGKGNIVTPEFTPKDLEKLVARNLLIFNLGLAVRSPRKFFKKYFLMVKNNPRIAFSFVKLLASRAL